MEYLTEEQVLNLKRIYKSENQSLHVSGFTDEDGRPHPAPEVLIAELVELDLIETEDDPSVYFLTPYGYGCLEVMEEGPDQWERGGSELGNIQLEDLIYKIGAKKFKKYIFIGLLFSCIAIAFYGYFYPNELKRKPVDLILTEEMIEDIKQKIKEKSDSIENNKPDDLEFVIDSL